MVCSFSVCTRAHTKGYLPLYRLVARLPDDEAPLSAVILGHICERRRRAPIHAQPLTLGLAPRLAEDDDRRSTRLSGDEARLPALGSAPRALKCDSNRRTAPAPRAVKHDHSARTGLALGYAGLRLPRLDCSQLLILLIAISRLLSVPA